MAYLHDFKLEEVAAWLKNNTKNIKNII
jgi:hypothetical protein